jgi:hypothetical protein
MRSVEAAVSSGMRVLLFSVVNCVTVSAVLKLNIERDRPAVQFQKMVYLQFYTPDMMQCRFQKMVSRG